MSSILVVDNRAINREFLVSLLTYAGYRVEEAADGEEALDLARAWHPSLVISDILMPNMDGLDLVRRLRANTHTADIPVIFYTATYRLKEAHDLARACGVSTVIAKPSEPEAILKAVAETISDTQDSVERPVVVGIHSGRRTQERYVSERLSSWIRDLTDLRKGARGGGGSPQPREDVTQLSTRVQALALRLSALIELGLEHSARRSPTELIDMYCRAAQDIVNAKFAGIAILENDLRRVQFFATHGLEEAQARAVRAAFDPTAKVLRQVVGDGSIQRLRDLDGDPTAAGLPTVHPPLHSFLAVPLKTTTRSYGLLYLADRLGADGFSEDDEQFALMLVGQLAPAYENLMLYGELRRYADRLEIEIAGRRRATENQRESEERYRLLWETTSDAVIMLDPDNRIRHANPAVKTTFGYEPQELIGQDLGMLQPQRLRDRHRRALAHYLDGDKEILSRRAIETTALHRNGTEFPVELSFSRLYVGGSPLFAAYVRDISERKRAETALRESQSFLEQAQEIGGIGSWMRSISDDLSLWWSRETYRIFGVAEGSGINFDTFRVAVHPDDRERVRQAAQTAIDSRTPYSIDHRIVRPDGSERWVHERADVVVDARGAPTRLIGVVQDITEQEQQRERIERLTRIYAVLSAINSAIIRVHERGALLAEACRIAVEAGRFPFAWIGMVDGAARRVQPVAWYGDEAGMLRVIEPVLSLNDAPPAQRGLAARAVLEKRAMVSNDIQTDTRIRFKRELGSHKVRSIAVLPLIVSGEAVGVMALRANEAGFFNDEEMKLLNELAGDISFGLQYIDKAEKLDYLAYYDALTDLPNSMLFHDRLSQLLNAARRNRRPVAVIVFDLDRFTQLNDTFGRRVCDSILQTVAQRLVTAVPEPSSVARIGADTFAVAVSDLHQGADAATILHNRVFATLGEAMSIEEQAIRVSARAGIALYPGDGSTADALFKNAEAALRQARASGARYLYYAPEINATVAEKLVLENRLRHAVEHQQFVLHYQPKFDARTRRLLGLEALLRWCDPDDRLVCPETFIGELEETGLILDVGRWVLERALSDHRRWRDRGLAPPRIAVNVSPLQLRQPEFADIVRTTIEAYAAGPQALEIELTESVIMEDIDANIEALRRISRAGVTIAIDDFGTGYSCLGYLAKLPVDSLKIDRSFVGTMVRDRDNMTIVSTIISLAHSLGLRVVAEGVETEEQALVLNRLGCDETQGHLHSQALPPEAVEAILRAAD